MSTIPKEEIEKIEAEAKNRYGQLYNLSKGIWTANEMLKNIEGAFSAGARWMHEQLATDGREELEKKLEYLTIEKLGYDELKKEDNLKSKQIEELKAENEKLIMLTRKLMVGGS